MVVFGLIGLLAFLQAMTSMNDHFPTETEAGYDKLLQHLLADPTPVCHRQTDGQTDRQTDR